MKVVLEWIVQTEASTGRVAIKPGVFCTQRDIKKSVPTTLDCITQSGFFKHGFIKWNALYIWLKNPLLIIYLSHQIGETKLSRIH